MKKNILDKKSLEEDNQYISLYIDNKDEKGFSLLYNKYKKHIDNTISILFNKYSLNNHKYILSKDDISQNVFISMYKNIHSFNRNNSLKSWIYVICKNTILDLIVKSKTFNINYISIDEVDKEKNEIDTEQEYFNKEIQDILTSCMIKSNIQDTELCKDILFDGDLKEICNKYNISYGALRVRSTRYKKQIKDILEKEYKEYLID